VYQSGMELSDTIPKQVADKLREILLNTKGVCRYEDLKIRRAGDKTFVRVTVQVPDYMGLDESHNLTSKIEADMSKALGNAVISIHTEPCKMEVPTEKLVEKLAMEVHDVKEVHEVTIANSQGKLYVTLHAYVDPRLTVAKAHEIADGIEQRVKKNLPDVEDVTVHIEPFSNKGMKGTAADEDEVRRIVHGIADNYQHMLRVKGIVTYVAGKKRHINIDCNFTKQLSIEEAHEIASKMEAEIGQHFSETLVTVHMEPSLDGPN
jgi:divalent metal cation (Fe/Co/Zn/Cd) transporter